MTQIAGKTFKADPGAKAAFRQGRSAHRFFVAVERIDGRGTVCWIEANADESSQRTLERVEKVIGVLEAGYQLLRQPIPVGGAR